MSTLNTNSYLTLLQVKQLMQQASPQEKLILWVQIEQKIERTAQTGSKYYEIKLADSTDKLTWRIFDKSTSYIDIQTLEAQDCIEIHSDWIDKGKYGIDPTNPKLRLLSESEKNLFLIGSPQQIQRIQNDFTCIETLVDSIQQPRYQALCKLFLTKWGDRFQRTAAARENHHARRGGLVEHVAQMMRSADALCNAYPKLHRDLLLTGVLFHDCGKLWENVYEEQGFIMPYQMIGELMGHITIGLEIVNKLWREIIETQAPPQQSNNDDTLRLHLLHLIASHHGQLDYGSPVVPKTPEAIVLHHIDNIDAKLEMMNECYQTSRELAPTIIEKVWPLPGHLIKPLTH
jgi:3'-5' exoribonuclease